MYKYNLPTLSNIEYQYVAKKINIYIQTLVHIRKRIIIYTVKPV